MGAAARASNAASAPIDGADAQGVAPSTARSQLYDDFDGMAAPSAVDLRIGKLDKYALPKELAKFLGTKTNFESRAYLEMWERAVDELPSQVRALQPELRDVVLAHFGAALALMEQKYPLHLQKGLVLLTFAHPHAPFQTDVGPVEMGVGFPAWEYTSYGITEKHHDASYELAPVFVRMDTIPLEIGALLWSDDLAALHTFQKAGKPAESYFLKREMKADEK